MRIYEVLRVILEILKLMRVISGIYCRIIKSTIIAILKKG